MSGLDAGDLSAGAQGAMRAAHVHVACYRHVDGTVNPA